MVLADPRLGIAVHVEPLHQLEIAFHAQERIFVIGMKRRQEDPSAQCGVAATPLPSGGGSDFDLWDQFRPAVEYRQDFVLIGWRQTHGHASDPKIAIAL